MVAAAATVATAVTASILKLSSSLSAAANPFERSTAPTPRPSACCAGGASPVDRRCPDPTPRLCRSPAGEPSRRPAHRSRAWQHAVARSRRPASELRSKLANTSSTSAPSSAGSRSRRVAGICPSLMNVTPPSLSASRRSAACLLALANSRRDPLSAESGSHGHTGARHLLCRPRRQSHPDCRSSRGRAVAPASPFQA